MVVAVGLTTAEPVAPTDPTPWSMVTVVALVVVQDKVAEPPRLTLAGAALNVAAGGGGGGLTVSVVVSAVEPLLFVAVTVYVVVVTGFTETDPDVETVPIP